VSGPEILGKVVDKKEEEVTEKVSDVVATKPFLISATALVGAGGLTLAEPDQGTVLAMLQPYAPALASLAGSFLVGFIVGKIARRKFRYVIIAGGIVVVAVTLLTKFGVIGPAADQWVDSSVGWINENMDKGRAYLSALLPSATAAAGGMYLGFRKKKLPG